MPFKNMVEKKHEPKKSMERMEKERSAMDLSNSRPDKAGAVEGAAAQRITIFEKPRRLPGGDAGGGRTAAL